jgi:UMF1 family MFS transporter
MTSFTAPLRTLEVRKTVRWVFLVAGVLFLLFTIPLAFFVPERRVARAQAFDWSVAREGLASVWKTLRTLPAKRNLFFFLLGNFLCVDVLNTAIAWFSKYFRAVFAFTFDDIITLGLGISGSAFLAGLVMGAVTDRVGSKPVLLAAAICLGLTLTVVGVTTIPWLALGTIFSVGALGLAGLWVAGRKFLIELAPPEKIGEYFGLYGITIKISVIGITVFAVLVDILPETKHLNYRVAILAQLLLIAPGILFLWLVKTPSKGEGKPSNA